jgi:hypothetical protein
MAFDQVGVEAVVIGMAQFNTQLNQMSQTYNITVNNIVKGAEKAAQATEKAESRMSSFTKGLLQGAAGTAGMNVALAAMRGKWDAVGAAVGSVAVKIASGFVSAIEKATSAIISFGMNAVMTAGQFQEMELTAIAIGKAMGQTEDETRAAIKTIQDAGIRYDVAAKTVAQLSRNQIDLAKSTDLARIAQATGIIVGQDSSETMEALVHAITSGSTIMLRRMGIFIDNAKVEEQFAKSVGKTVDALTTQEVLSARTNAIIENSAAIMGVYDAAMESPTKRLRSLTGRVIPELIAQVGAPFLQAFSTVVESVTNVVKALSKATEEGGSLYPVLITLGAAASLMADGFAAGADMLIDFINTLGGDMNTGFSDITSDMLRWGFEMIAALAEGMADGISSTLTVVMDALEGFLSFFLAPGSPPKVAPMLDKWGAEAMNTYLEGFTEADFDILEKLQGIFKQILGSADYAQLSADMIQALSGEGVDESFYTRLATAAGEFGEQIADLARDQVGVAQATEKVAAAEKAASQARNAVSKTQTKLSRQIREYNQMVREGAGKAALDAKKKEITATEKELQLNQKRAIEAQDAKDAAKDELAIRKGQFGLQERLVGQLLEIAKAQQEANKEAEKTPGVEKAGKGGKAEPIIPEIALPPAIGGDISNRMGELIDRMKEELKGKLANIFEPLTTAMDNIKVDFAKLWLRWNALMTDIKVAWDTYAQPIVDKILDFGTKLYNMIPEDIRTKIEEFGDTLLLSTPKVAGFGLALDILATYVPLGRLLIIPIMLTKIGEGIGKAIGNLLPESAKKNFQTAALAFIGDFEDRIDDIRELAGMVTFGITSDENLEKVAETIKTVLAKIGKTFIENRDEAWAWGTQTVTDIAGGIGASFQKMITAGAQLIDDLQSGIQTKYAELNVIGGTIIQKISDGFTGATDTIGGMGTAIVDGISNKIAGKWGELKGIGDSVATAIKDGISEATTVFDDIVTAISTNITTAMGGLTFISDMYNLGKDIVDWIAGGIKASIHKIGDAFKNVICDAFPWIPGCGGGEEDSGGGGEQELRASNRAKQFVMPTTQPVFAAQQSQSQQIYKSSAVQIGPNYINNDLDTAMLQSMVERALVRALR